MNTKTKTIKAFFAVIAAIMAFVFASFSLTGCNLVNNNENEPPEKPLTPSYTVTFDSNGGSAVKSQNVEEDAYAARPKDPKKQGFAFAGWYKDSGLTQGWDFVYDTVTKDITLYAKWDPSSQPVDPDDPDDPDDDTVYTVTFDSNGGSAVKSQEIESGAYVGKPQDPAKDGYRFDGWYKDSEFKTAWNFTSDAVTEDITLYAKWEIIVEPDDTVYTVTFDSKGGSSVSSQDVIEGGYASKPQDPSRNGYSFCGWYKDSGLKTEWNFTSDAVTEDITLYAKWDEIEVPVIPVGEGVTATFNVGYDARVAGASNPAAQTVKSGNKITAPTVTLAGCSITGWYEENGNKKWNFNSDVLTKDTTLFARWQGTFPSVGSGSSGGGSSDEREEYTPTLIDSGSLYIHYLRSDGNYDGWKIWGWKEGSNGAWFDKVDVDKSGAVYKVTINGVTADSTVGFLVVKGEWGNDSKKDGDANNMLALSNAEKVSGSYHWYVQSGRVASGTPYLAKANSPSGDGKVDRSFAKNLDVMNTAENTDDMGVGYQIFVASFCDSDGDGMGDIRGIINKLDYLESLNVDVLWLTPIQSSDSYHGYDCYDYYAIDPKFGTNADYRELTYKAHQRGMKIIMDLVVNHTSPKNEWFLKSKNGVVETITYQDGTTKTVDYTNYYRWSSTKISGRWYDGGNGKYFYSSFGSGMPELNYDYQVARDAMADVAMYWMAYGLDGFRMDAIKHMFMWDESTNEQGDTEGRPEERESGYNFNLTKDVEWFKEFNYRLKTKYPYAFTLGENLTGDVSAVAPFYAGMDSLFDFNTYYDLPTNIKTGNASKTANALNSNANAYASARNGAGRAINSMITSNHDVSRLAYLCGSNTEYQKLYFAVMMTMPGLSWIYYGDEIGMYGGASNNFSDQMARQPMKWTSDWQNKAHPNGVHQYGYDDELLSVADQTSESTLLYYVKSLTKLRHDHPALIHGTATCSEQNGILKIVVKDGDTVMTVYHNFSASTKTANATDKLVFGSASIPAYGTAVFSNK